MEDATALTLDRVASGESAHRLEEPPDESMVAEAATQDLPTRPHHRVIERLRPLACHAPVTVLTVATVAWALKFGQLVHWRHDRFGSFDFDSGIFDQAGWLLAHGRQFNTVRGLDLFGHHVTFGFYFFAPVYWLGLDGVAAMNLAQVASLAAGAPVTYWVARKVGLDSWIALGVALVYLGHFSTGWLAQELFHPEVFAMTPLLAAVGFGLGGRRRAYWLALLYAMCWKEDVALAVAGLAALWWWRGERKLAWRTAALGVAWFLIATQVVIPLLSPTGEAFYAQGFYGDLGNSFSEVGWNSLRHPSRAVTHLDNSNAVGYVRDLLVPFGFSSLLAPAALVMMVPQLVANLLSVHNFTASVELHYVALPLAASTLGCIFGLARLRSHQLRSALLGAALASTLASAVTWGVGPGSNRYDDGYWPLIPHEAQADLEVALALVPDDAAVAASYHLVPHLSAREKIYSFPNPWEPWNWGIDGHLTHDPDTVDYLVVLRSDLGPEHADLLERILAAEDFVVVFSHGDVVVAGRP